MALVTLHWVSNELDPRDLYSCSVYLFNLQKSCVLEETRLDYLLYWVLTNVRRFIGIVSKQFPTIMKQ